MKEKMSPGSIQQLFLIGKEKFSVFLQQTSWTELILFSLVFILALLLRYSLRSVITSDYEYFFKNWYIHIKAQGFKSLAGNFSNYPPLYLYLLYLVSLLFPGISTVTAIKIPSIVFDFICALYVYRLVRLKFQNSFIPVFAALTVLFAPTVVLNGCVWGQIESIYTAGLLACLYYLLTEKRWLACIAFGLAFSIKLQSLYLAPFLLVLWIKKDISIKYLLTIPGVYFLTIIPAWVAGRPIFELLTIYSSQVSGYEGLVHNATSLFAWLPQANYQTWYLPGLILAAAICLLYVLFIIKSKIGSIRPHWTLLALGSLLMVPFFLPKTHDRYYFPADVFSIVFAFYYPKYFFIPILINLTSFFIYQPYLFGIDIFPQTVLTFGIFIAIALILWIASKRLYPPSISEKTD
jgi:Gpi18-like mannosyltransferase